MQQQQAECESNGRRPNGMMSKSVTGHGSGVREFYADKTVLVTGGTGFLGKVLVEKLVRACPKVGRVLLLVRGQPRQRLDAYFADPIFSSIRTHAPRQLDKVEMMAGDVTLRDLGLGSEELERVQRDVHVVFHMAATVSFKEQLERATQVNVVGTDNLLRLACRLQRLVALVHVSTAYSNYPLSRVEERVYPAPVQAHRLMRMVRLADHASLRALADRLLRAWPNVYTVTKAAAEELVAECAHRLPVAVYRPAIVSPAASEPLAGWTDNYNGPMGMGASVAAGVTRAGRVCLDANSNMVPVDLVVNGMLAVAWQLASEERHRGVPVYNFGSARNPLTWARYERALTDARVFPVARAAWWPEFAAVRAQCLQGPVLALLHTAPAYLADAVLRLARRRARFVHQYARINFMLSVLSHFSARAWHFDDDNVRRLWRQLPRRDRGPFPFDIAAVDWDAYLVAVKRGLSLYLLDGAADTADCAVGAVVAARARHVRLFWLHHALKSALLLAFFCTLYRCFICSLLVA